MRLVGDSERLAVIVAVVSEAGLEWQYLRMQGVREQNSGEGLAAAVRKRSTVIDAKDHSKGGGVK